MKNVKLTFVLMAGLPGTGKSTLALALYKELGWTVIDKDAYKAAFLNDESASMDDKSASLMAYEKSFRVAEDELIKQKSVILDSAALRPVTIQNAENTAADVEAEIKEKVQIKVILCYVSRELRKKREQEKKSRIRLSPTSNTTTDPFTMDEYLRDFEHLPSDRLVLDTENSLVECLLQARKYLTG